MSYDSPFPDGHGDGQDPEPPPPRRPWRTPALIVFTLVVALGLGYLVGHGHGGSAVQAEVGITPPSTSAVPVTSVPSLAPKAVVPSPPVRIDIPSIGVDGDLVDLHLQADGTLEVPVDFQQVGWYADGAVPGDTRKPPTIVAGHVDSYEGRAVFSDLGKVEIGAQVRITQADGTVAVFVVYAASEFSKDTFPAAQVYRERPDSELVLITCTGDFDESARSYYDNLVLTARLDPALSGTAS